MTRRSTLAVGALIGVACSEADSDVELVFTSELLSAPVRSIDVVVFEDLDCSAVNELAFDGITEALPAVRRQSGRFPLRPDFTALPSGRGPYTVAVAARDIDGWVVARGCTEASESARPVLVSMTLRPSCVRAPAWTDFALILDATGAARSADAELGGALISTLIEELSANVPFDRYRAVFARDDGLEEVHPTDASTLSARLSAIELRGRGRLVDGLLLGARRLRHDVSCAYAPRLMAVAADGDASSVAIPFDVVLNLSGDENDPTDDLEAVGLALSDLGSTVLRASLPDPGRTVVGAQTEASYRFQVRTLIQRLQP